MNINARIAKRRKEIDLSRKDMAAEVGVTAETIRKWELQPQDGGITPRQTVLEKLAKALKTSPDWLLVGNGGSVESEQRVNSKYVFIPRYHSRLQGRDKSVQHHEEISYLNDEADTYAYRLTLLEANGWEAHNLRVLELHDSNMRLNGQLLIDMSQKNVVTGKAYALDSPAGVTVRRLYPRITGDMVAVRADAPDVPEEMIAIDQLHIVGRVVACQSTQDDGL